MFFKTIRYKYDSELFSVCVCVFVCWRLCVSVPSNCRGLCCFQPTWERWSSPCSLIKRTTVSIVPLTRQRYTQF